MANLLLGCQALDRVSGRPCVHKIIGKHDDDEIVKSNTMMEFAQSAEKEVTRLK